MDIRKITHSNFVVLLLLCVSYNFLLSQSAQTSFRLLNMPVNARHAGMADLAIVQWDRNIQAGAVHPALLRPEMSKQWYVHFSNQGPAFKQHGLFTAYSIKKAVLGIGIRSIQARQLKGMDDFGNATSSFNVGEYQCKIYYKRFIADSIFSIGIGTGLLWQQFELYRAFASTCDASIMAHLSANTHLALNIKNVGWIWHATYTANSLPFTTQFGISHKLSKAPFRLMLVYEGLEQFNRIVPKQITNTNTAFNTPITDSTDWQKFAERSSNFFKMLSNHIQLGTEVVFSEQFKLSFGYTFRRAQEEELERSINTTGLNFGMMFQTRRFGFSYGFQNISVPLGGHYVTFTIPIKSLRRAYK